MSNIYFVFHAKLPECHTWTEQNQSTESSYWHFPEQDNAKTVEGKAIGNLLKSHLIPAPAPATHRALVCQLAGPISYS